ncbi:helix-turn-helix domain-containing GNAT family N-acetyltransferase [Muriicola sp. Z0-33]|uniref:bifunctional helix-turn-helix transcriptional regulator/GNAT family N-acetyltransferase n=1 Tax=Muriicola sp. Z0-33 TaxID=2816957 RepID=UPI002237777F|nr:helix-turn-helix domain-containing GNAT family N-acetyltransferase [Muriicola sp. Z0-33]MCW5516993.1 GNAT family N-acetyltransferase [Muriicola sp. Z0-33]
MFFNKVGKMAIGSRLRMLNERISEDAQQLYQIYGVELKPKWFPVFYMLSTSDSHSITAIAKEIGHSHPSVSKIVREMSKAGLVDEQPDENDGRKNIISLSEKGQKIRIKIKDQYADVDKAIENALEHTTHNLWIAMEEFEYMLDQNSLLGRVLDEKKKREAKKVEIVDYEEKYRQHFKSLNEEWIRKYFKMEEMDHKALDHPKTYILDNGGHILVALYEGEAVGVCALIKIDHPQFDYELAKMGVSPKAQGKGIGWLLGNAIIDKAKSLGATSLYLESNTVLKPAIALYRKLGFNKISGIPTPYKRSNIQMEMKINP